MKHIKTLVLGTGGREHALAWRIAADVGKENVFLHPGNAGTVGAGFQLLGAESINTPELVAARARELGISLVVIGPEGLLAGGFGDVLRRLGFDVVGPDAKGAMLETSKIFAKGFMTRAEVPTAPFSVASSADELMLALGSKFPVVLKLDGLAAGKGVIIAQNAEEARQFGNRVWGGTEFRGNNHRILIEQFIPGKELSYIGLCDGNRFVPLSSATDYKRAGDGDTGPNTGGMGVISPSPVLTPEVETKIQERIVPRILKQLQREGIPYRGALYIGLMITPSGDPHVLEFNARFGDPETQALMLRLEGSFVELLGKTASGELASVPEPKFRPECAVYVVAASEGYPMKPKLGDTISGLDTVDPDARVFFSGVQKKSGFLVTGGGRVLGIGCLGAGHEDARAKVYRNLKKIHWRGMHFRNDIGSSR